MMLLVALDYRKEDPMQMGEGKDENAFRYFISKLVSRLNRDMRMLIEL